MQYQYLADPQSVDQEGNFVRRPVVQIELLGKTEKFLVFALIDSGADITTLNIEYAKRLGVELSEDKKTHVVGIGDAVGYYAEVSLQVDQMPDPITIRAIFVDSPHVHALLGQEGFFEAYDVKFLKSQGIFELTPSS